MNIGSYTLTKKIAEGNFGRTYLAKHNILDRKVCVKQEKTGIEDYKKLFRQEAMMIGGLRQGHPSLPYLIDYIEHTDPKIGQMMILSYAEGENLESIVEKNGPIDDEHICWILDRILGALSYLHYHGIIHSDLKPENVILDIDDHNATVVDLGMASLRPDEYSKAKGGTMYYLPPEFGLGKPPIPSSDIYSLGKIAIRLSGGNIGNGSIPDDMKPSIKEIIEEMVRIDPMQRPKNADELRSRFMKARMKEYGRTSTVEKFKFRSGKSL